MIDGTLNLSSTAAAGSGVTEQSGICPVCLDGCTGLCEIAKSSYRGREVIYPKPLGKVTAGSVKKYPVDYSHLNIQGTCVGAAGVRSDPDKASFPAVSTETAIGNKYKVRLSLPVLTGALGSADIAKDNWEGLAIGAAISGIIVVLGENVAGMDPGAVYKRGKVVHSPELERRVNLFKHWHDSTGEIILQQNVQDTRLASAEYAIEKLGVRCIELKWGQAVKDIGTEGKPGAGDVKKKGHMVIKKAFEEQEIKEFERSSRLGTVSHEEFVRSVEHYRNAGAKFVSLKTGAYRITDLARAIRFASDAEIDLLTIGGAGMGPWRMMNEWGIPTIYIQSIAYKFASQLKAKGMHVPDLVIAGEFSLEDHIFKALALGAPHFRAVCMGRALMIPAFIGKNLQGWISEGRVPDDIRKFGEIPERIFITLETLKDRFGKDFRKLPLAAVAMYTFCDRLKAGLQQLMAGTRKFALKHLDRNDLVSLTKEATEVTGIPYVMEADMEEAQRILLC